MSELISVIIPVYNAEAYIDDCLKSVTAQTYKNLEIILVNDGSGDNSLSLCEKWAEADSRIKVINKQNGGASSARNAGLKIANGDYIGFVDSDDIIDNKMYEKLLGALKNSDKKIADCLVKTFVSCDEIPKVTDGKITELDFNKSVDCVFLREIDVSMCCKLFEKSVFSSISFPEGETNEEVSMILPMLKLSNGIVRVEIPLYFYRQSNTSVTSSYYKTDADIVLKNLKRVYKQYCDMGLNNIKSFKIYTAVSVFSTSLYLDKNYYRINNNAKQNFKKYLSVMRKLIFTVLFTKRVILKDKILYLMVATRTLRPIYKILGKK